MKRYAVISDPEPFGATHDDLESAIASAKEYVIEDRETFYVVELVGAVHPGKPRWRPTERNKELKPQEYTYKIRIKNYPIDRPVPLAKEIIALTGASIKDAKSFMDGYEYFVVRTTNGGFASVKSRLEDAGATIDYKIS